MDRLMETFAISTIFARHFFPQASGFLLAGGSKRGPDGGLSASEMMTIVVMYHQSRFRDFKTFYRA